MRHLTLSVAAGAVLILAASAAVGQPAANPNDPPPLDRDALHTVVCQEYAAATGSRIGRRMVCLTNLQWQEVHRLAREGYALEVKKSYTMGHNI